MDKYAIIKLVKEGNADRKIARDIGVNRKTVTKYRREYEAQLESLGGAVNIRQVQEDIVSAPSYDTSSRRPVKYTDEVDKLVEEILKDEAKKDEILGNHKQKLTNVKIHKMVLDAGHDIGLTTLSDYIRKKRMAAKEAFIRQEYELGDRVEYDFGEVKLVIGKTTGTYHIAVFGSPSGKHRWAYLYDNQKKEVFMDSHVRYFEWLGGIHKEVVYDNMKNVVTRFIGKNEKQLNEDLVKMSLYYGFSINVTNCYSGNEKGYVENSVKTVRREVFSGKYRFDSLEDAEIYLHSKLDELNEGSCLSEERQHLLQYKPPLELAKLSKQKPDKYSFVRVENNFYSVPEHLVGYEVTIKNYLKEIEVYANSGIVCKHKKIDGFAEMQVDIYHYLDTFQKKPGALKNSKALKSKSELKAIYDNHFTKRTKEFIDVLRENSEKEYDELLSILKDVAGDETVYRSSDDTTMEDHIHSKTKSQLSALSQLFMNGGSGYVN